MEETIIKTDQSNAPARRRDLLALWGGILFSLLFTGVIWWAGQRLDTSNFLPDTGPSWYFWRLPNPTFWTHATAWGFYLAHQITLWVIIYMAQKNLRKYTTGLSRLNILALGANAFFILLHFVQTQIWYDGLAQDVSIWSSQVSVIILLVWVLLMENRRRGLFAGKKAPISKEIGRFARRYHGYFFAWAIVYTFWYHPMQPTSGHLIGFFYMFLLLLQGSLFFTRIHVNRYWTVVLEFTVLVHGALVAVMQGNNIWPMFAFGFGGMFVITQMHGLGLKKGIKWFFLAAYIGLALLVYNQRGYAKIYEIINIPIIEYLGVAVLALLFGAGLRIARALRKENEQAEPEITTG